MHLAEVEPWVDRKEKEEKRKEKEKKRKEKKRIEEKKRNLNHVFEWMKYICNINLNLISLFIGVANSFPCPFIRVLYKE